MKRVRKIVREILKEALYMGGDDLLVKNYPYNNEETDTVGEISRFVMRKVAYDLLPQLDLTREEKNRIRDTDLMEIFMPDGTDYFEQIGTMNIYSEDIFPSRYIDKIIAYTKYILNEKDIFLGEVTKEFWNQVLTPEKMKKYNKDKDSIRVISFQIIKNDSVLADEHQNIHLSDSTWRKLFEDILGYEEYKHIYLDASELIMKIQEGRKTINTISNFDKGDDEDYDVAYDIRMQQHGHMYQDVKNKEYFLNIMDKVEELAKWALSKGYPKLYLA